jgi:beta-N-acetylhexosaminidase
MGQIRVEGMMAKRNVGLLVLIAAAAGCAAATRVPPGPGGAPASAVEDWAVFTLNQLTLRQKVAQLLMPRIGGEYVPVRAGAYDRLVYWVRDLEVGGVIITTGPPLETAAKLNMLQALANVPLLVSADMEHGPGQILRGGVILPYGLETGGATRFPPVMALGATGDEALAYELGRITAIEARATGVHVVFAPVVDVNNNPANPIINTRSYGADPALVSRMAAAHVRGLQDHGAIATVKHFPGHGDTGTDSHVDLPFIGVDRVRADQVELPPYRAAFEAGAAAVMTAHISFPALTGDSVPATLHPRLINGLLRSELGFDGLVFTDALDMGAIVKGYGSGTAAVMSLQAGADVLLQMLPQDVPVIIDAVLEAVARGELTEARIDESLLRLLRTKQRLGLHEGTRVSLDRIPEVVGAPAHQAAAEQAARRGMTAVRNDAGLLPLRARSALSIIYTDAFDPLTGRSFNRELEQHVPDVVTVLLDASADESLLRAVAEQADAADVVLFSPFIRVMAGHADHAVAEHVVRAITAIAARRPTVITSFGNPYVLQQFPAASTYVLAWAQWDPVQRAAARALVGLTPIEGRLPIPIPPLHGIGEGLRIAPLRAAQ